MTGNRGKPKRERLEHRLDSAELAELSDRHLVDRHLVLEGENQLRTERISLIKQRLGEVGRSVAEHRLAVFYYTKTRTICLGYRYGRLCKARYPLHVTVCE